jgi:hypothetical protein
MKNLHLLSDEELSIKTAKNIEVFLRDCGLGYLEGHIGNHG